MTKEQISKLIIDEVDEMIFIIDMETDEILYMNSRAMDFLSLKTDEQWKNKLCHDVICDCHEYCDGCSKQRLLDEGSYAFERFNESKKRFLYKKFKLITIEGRPAQLCVTTDITKHHETTLELEHKLNIEKTMLNCIKTLYEVADMDVAINRLLSLVAEFYNADRSYIFEFNEDGVTMNNTYEWCNADVSSQINILQNIEITVIDRWMSRFEESGEFYITSRNSEVDRDSVEYHLLELQNIESLMAAPLKLSGEIVGFLGVDNPEDNTDNLLLLQSVSAFVIDDIHKRKNMAQLYDLSFRDRLTGVGNRHAYVKYMEKLEKEADKSLGIIFADINGLKKANDEFGHEYGDNIIKSVAEILKNDFADNVFRVGGDEFVIFCVGIGEDEFYAKVDNVKASWKDGITASVGGLWFADCMKVEDKVNRADAVMYDNKKRYYADK